MKKTKLSFEHPAPIIFLGRQLLLTIPLSFATGSLVAFFLWLLDKATLLRERQGGLLYLLPLSGVLIWWLYKAGGKNAASGNNLVLDEIHMPGGGVPLRMAPLVLLTTVVTHLFGGSAGREGTAVQIGGSLAGRLAKGLKLETADRAVLLRAGIAAGFGAVFGTPLAGAVFALEVVYIRRLDIKALFPCLLAAFLADKACLAWGILHTQYHIVLKPVATVTPSLLFFDGILLLKAAAAGIGFGLASRIFSEMVHSIKALSGRFIPRPWLIPVFGGLAVIGLSFILGRDYLGLGVRSADPHAVTILSCFRAGGAGTLSWFWKILFTAVTLGMGFKGGEVTPLFFVGAALGNVMATLGHAPVDLMAGLGFIAVFAAAANTPLACVLMGIELFGTEYLLYYIAACFIAWLVSGNTGIYSAQRVRTPGDAGGPGTVKTLETIREERLHRRRSLWRKTFNR